MQLIVIFIVDRVGPRRLALIGLSVMVIGLVWALTAVYCTTPFSRWLKCWLCPEVTTPTDHLLVGGADYNRSLAGVLIGAIAFFAMGYGVSYSHLSWYRSEFLALGIRLMGPSGINNRHLDLQHHRLSCLPFATRKPRTLR